MITILKFIFVVMATINNNEVHLHGLDIDLVNRKDGLYKENTRYVYKGSNPNNYILFNNELFRIIAFEENGTIKIIKNESIGNFSYDINNSSDWENSSLRKYLNNDYYNHIKSEFCELNKFNDYVELISMQDYISANSNTKKCGDIDLYFKNENLCYNTNYLNNNKPFWTLTKDHNNVYYGGSTYFPDSETRFEYAVLPVLSLKSTVSLTGKGTMSLPYKINAP